MRARRRKSAGLTKLELLLALGSLGLVAGTGLVLIQGRADDQQKEKAALVAKRLAGAVSDWKREHGDLGCPSVSQLLQEKRWSRRDPADDPWGGRFRISCSSEQVSVKSAGGDGRFETEDDIAVESDWNS